MSTDNLSATPISRQRNKLLNQLGFQQSSPENRKQQQAQTANRTHTLQHSRAQQSEMRQLMMIKEEMKEDEE
jgi:hypothetical protein